MDNSNDHDDSELSFPSPNAAKRQGVNSDPQVAVELVASMWHLWFWRGYWRKGVDWARRVFAAAETLHTPAGASALAGVSNLAGRAGDYATSATWLAQGSAIAERLGVTEARVWAKIALSVQTSDNLLASALLEKALVLARADGNMWQAANMLCVLGDQARASEDYDRAVALYGEGVALFR